MRKVVGRPFPSRALAAAVVLLAAAPVGAAAQTPGETLYAQNCAACHQRTGAGVPGAFPPMVGDLIALGPTDRLAALILHGRGGMPSFRNDLNDEQIAAALTYIRSAWGNGAPAVAPAAVKAARGGDAPPPANQAIQAH